MRDPAITSPSVPVTKLGPSPAGGPVRRAAARLMPWLLVAFACACLFFMLRFIVASSGATLDFAGFYGMGAILRRGAGGALYNVALQHNVERTFLAGGHFFPLDHPPFEAWLCLPLAYFSYGQAYLLWAAFNLLVLGVVFYLLPRTGYRLDANTRLVWLATCFPIAGGALVLGQDSLLLVPVFLFGYLALKKRRDFLAGLALGVGLFRFEILLPFVFIFLLRRRWKVVAGFAATSVVALLASVALVGWNGLVNYSRVLLAASKTTGSQANGIVAVTMPSLRGAVVAFLGGVVPSAALFPIVLAGTLLLLFWAAWQFKNVSNPSAPQFDLQFSMATLAALLSSYHIFVHELTPLIVIGFLMLGYEDLSRGRDSLLKRPGALLLLLFTLVIVVGETAGFRNFSVVFVVLFGLVIWLSQEISAPVRGAAPH